MIGVIGKVGVGKTTFLKTLNNQKTIFYADEYIEKEYKKNGLLYQIINQKIGTFLNNENGIDKSKIKNWLVKDKENINALEKVIYPIIYKELKSKKYLIAELPIIKNRNFDFSSLFSLILCLETSDEKRLKNLAKRNVDKKTLELIDQKNSPKMLKKQLFGKIPIVDIYASNYRNTKKNKWFLKFVFGIF